MPDGTGGEVSPVAGANQKNMMQLVAVLIAVLGVGGGGSYFAANSASHSVGEDMKTEIKTDLRGLSTQMEAQSKELESQGRSLEKMDDRLDQVVVLGQQVANLQTQISATQKDMDELKRDLKDRSHGEKLTQLQLALQKQLAEMSDRITRIESVKPSPAAGDK